MSTPLLSSAATASPPGSAAPGEGSSALAGGLAPPLASTGSPSALVLAVAVVGSLVVAVGAQRGLVSGVGALVAVLAALGLLVRPALAGLALVCLVPLLPGLARGLLVPGAKISEVVVFGASCLVLLICGRRGRVPFGGLDLLVLAYVLATIGLGVLDMRLHAVPLDLDTATTLFAPVQYLLLFRAVRVSLPTAELRRIALRWALYLSTVMSAVALAQQVAGGAVNPVLVRLTSSDAALGGTSTGLFAGKHDLGGYLIVVVVLASGLLLTPGQRVLPPVRLWAVLALAGVALACTVAFASVGGAVLGIALMARRRKRLAPAMTGLVVVGAATAVLFGPTLFSLGDRQFTSPPVVTSTTSAPTWLPQSLAYRVAVWHDQYLPALTPHLLTGYGPTLPPDIDWKYTESAYLSLLLRGGLPLLLVFGAVSLALYARARRAEGDADPAQRALGLAVAALVVVLTVIDVTNPYILNSGLPHLFWALAGLLAGPTAARGVPVPEDAGRLHED